MQTSYELQGKTALVTGGSGGIGRSLCSMLARQGAYVIDAAVDNPDEAFSGNTPGSIVRRYVDVSRPESVDVLFAWMDAVSLFPDMLINNAGVFAFHAIHEMDIADWQKTIRVNLDGVFYCTRAALQRMLSRQSGLLIHIGSIAGQTPLAGNGAYGVSKAGVAMLSRLINLEYAAQGIKSSLLVLGAVSTDVWTPQPGLEKDAMLTPDAVAGAALDLIRMNVSGRAEELVLLPEYRFKP